MTAIVKGWSNAGDLRRLASGLDYATISPDASRIDSEPVAILPLTDDAIAELAMRVNDALDRDVCDVHDDVIITALRAALGVAP